MSLRIVQTLCEIGPKIYQEFVPYASHFKKAL